MLVIRTLMTYLELMGYLVGGTPFYSQYQFKPLTTSREILDKFDGERRQFLASLFRQAKKAVIWLSIDVDQAASDIGCPRERIVRALDYLGDQQMLVVRVQGVRNRYRRAKPCQNLPALAEQLHGKTVEREQREISRLRQVLKLAEHNGCHWRELCRYFGETLAAACGHCAWCQNGQQPVAVPQRPHHALADTVWDQAIALRREHPDVLQHPQAVARFLCGVTSPWLSKAKLTSHPLFGAAAQAPFPDIVRRFMEA
jgi:ATP-dependent DNA helicase RecQ